jgi:AcrR family transcriptional regulator
MKAPVERSPRKAKGQGAERREEILDAALRLCGEFGIYGVSTRQIAEAAGISQPTLYAYFDGRDAIILELHVRAFQALEATLRSEADHPMSTPADLARGLRHYIDFGLANPDAYRVAFMLEGPATDKDADCEASGLLPQGQAVFEFMRGKIADLHARGLTCGLDPEILSQSLWAAMHGLVALLLARPGFPWVERETLIAAHLDLLARAAMGAPPRA